MACDFLQRCGDFDYELIYITTTTPTTTQLNSTLFDENEHMNIITGHKGLEAAYICPTYK